MVVFDGNQMFTCEDKREKFGKSVGVMRISCK